MLIYTVIYIKLIRKKYLLHRIGNSTEQIVITCMREKKKKKTKKKPYIFFSIPDPSRICLLQLAPLCT